MIKTIAQMTINPSSQKKARARPREPSLNREDLGRQSTDYLDRQQSARCRTCRRSSPAQITGARCGHGGASSAGGRLRYYIAVLCLLMDVGKMHKVSGILLMITVVNTSIGRTIGLICL